MARCPPKTAFVLVTVVEVDQDRTNFKTTVEAGMNSNLVVAAHLADTKEPQVLNERQAIQFLHGVVAKEILDRGMRDGDIEWTELPEEPS